MGPGKVQVHDTRSVHPFQGDLVEKSTVRHDRGELPPFGVEVKVVKEAQGAGVDALNRHLSPPFGESGGGGVGKGGSPLNEGQEGPPDVILPYLKEGDGSPWGEGEKGGARDGGTHAVGDAGGHRTRGDPAPRAPGGGEVGDREAGLTPVGERMGLGGVGGGRETIFQNVDTAGVVELDAFVEPITNVINEKKVFGVGVHFHLEEDGDPRNSVKWVGVVEVGVGNTTPVAQRPKRGLDPQLNRTGLEGYELLPGGGEGKGEGVDLVL